MSRHRWSAVAALGLALAALAPHAARALVCSGCRMAHRLPQDHTIEPAHPIAPRMRHVTRPAAARFKPAQVADP